MVLEFELAETEVVLTEAEQLALIKTPLGTIYKGVSKLYHQM